MLHLKLPDLLALLGNLSHRLPHQSDQHVQQQDKGEDDVGDQEDEEDGWILGAVDHVQLAHPDGQFEEIQQESAEGVRVPALRVGGAAPVALGARWWTHRQKGHQGCVTQEVDLKVCWRALDFPFRHLSGKLPEAYPIMKSTYTSKNLKRSLKSI